MRPAPAMENGKEKLKAKKMVENLIALHLFHRGTIRHSVFYLRSRKCMGFSIWLCACARYSPACADQRPNRAYLTSVELPGAFACRTLFMQRNPAQAPAIAGKLEGKKGLSQ